MKLEKWVRTDERNYEEMAGFVGVHTSTFARWVTGKAVPSKRHARKIRELTNDQVTLLDFQNRRRRRPFTKKEGDHA